MCLADDRVLPMNPHRVRRLACCLVVVLGVVACGPVAASESPNDGRIDVVASTDVWADVVRSVGGRAVTVTTIIDSSTADPHSYSATPRDAARVSEADLVVYNGGGYDTFMSDLVNAVGPDGGHVLAAFRAAGHDSGNEHIWYRPDDVARVAAALADQLERLRPGDAATFRGNVTALREKLDSVEQRIDRIAATHEGRRVLTTSPLAEPLISAARLESVTPPEFTAAVESGHGIPVLLQHR